MRSGCRIRPFLYRRHAIHPKSPGSSPFATMSSAVGTVASRSSAAPRGQGGSYRVTFLTRRPWLLSWAFSTRPTRDATAALRKSTLHLLCLLTAETPLGPTRGCGPGRHVTDEEKRTEPSWSARLQQTRWLQFVRLEAEDSWLGAAHTAFTPSLNHFADIWSGLLCGRRGKNIRGKINSLKRCSPTASRLKSANKRVNRRN